MAIIGHLLNMTIVDADATERVPPVSPVSRNICAVMGGPRSVAAGFAQHLRSTCGRDGARPSRFASFAQHLRSYGRAALRRGRFCNYRLFKVP